MSESFAMMQRSASATASKMDAQKSGWSQKHQTQQAQRSKQQSATCQESAQLTQKLDAMSAQLEALLKEMQTLKVRVALRSVEIALQLDPEVDLALYETGCEIEKLMQQLNADGEN